MGQYLSSPCTLVELEECTGTKMEYCVGSLQGWRVSMEDSHIGVIGLKDNGTATNTETLDKDENGLFAVFDGHGGKEVALFSEAKFEEILISSVEFAEGRYEDALKRTFHKIDEMLNDVQYDDYLKHMKKLPNPVAYSASNHPSFPSEKIARNIKYSEVNLSRFGNMANSNNNIISGSTVTPSIVAAQGLTVTMESSSLNKIDDDEEENDILLKNNLSRIRAPTLNQNEDDAVDYDQLSHEIESKMAIKEEVEILTEEIKEMLKKGEIESIPSPRNTDPLTATVPSSSSTNDQSKPKDDFKMTPKHKQENSPTKGISGSSSTLAKLIIANSPTNRSPNETEFVHNADSKAIGVIDNTDGSVEEEEDSETLSNYKFTIPPRAPITPSVEPVLLKPIGPGGPGSVSGGIIQPPVAIIHDVPPTQHVCRLTNHRISAGCTANVALKIKNKLYVANAGDSRAVLCQGNGIARELSLDHKPNDYIEKNRVENAGGFVNAMGRINGNLNLSRSLGDLKYKQSHDLPPEKQIITAEPDVVVYDIQPDDQFLIIGCDGIWDCLTSQEACTIVSKKLKEGMKPNEIVPYVLQLILATDTILSKGIGTDNMTLLILVFKK